MLHISITPTDAPKPHPDANTTLGFGHYFSDHMFLMEYTAGSGWRNSRIVPYGPLLLDPATAVFHYAQEIFEGLKAYRGCDGKIRLFRPECNARRFNDSARRMCIPQIPEEDFLQVVQTLVSVERDWVPDKPGLSYYLRPFCFAADVGLGVHSGSRFTFCIIGSPTGSYYAHWLDPVRIYVEDQWIRSAPGLTGAVKCGGNYGASILAGHQAERLGYDQVLWLDGLEHRYVEEVGAMNILFKIDGVIYTAPTTGTVLPGITRRSVLELLNMWGYPVAETRLAIADIMAASRAGKLEEVFGTGTAAVISPVKELFWRGESAIVNNGAIGPLSQRLYDTLTGIQQGSLPDTMGWMTEVPCL